MEYARVKYEFKKRYLIKKENYVSISTKVYTAYDNQKKEIVMLVVNDLNNDFEYVRYAGFKSQKAAYDNANTLAGMLRMQWQRQVK